MLDLTDFNLNTFRALVRRSGRWSPPDWLFLPLTTVLAIALISFALTYRPGVVHPEYTETQFVMRGAALGQLVPWAGTRFQMVASADGAPMARLSATASYESAKDTSIGVAAFLEPAWEARVIGRVVRFEAEVQRALNSSVQGVRLGYYTAGYGDSDRGLIAIGASWRRIGLCFQVPAAAQATNGDYVGIWPGEAGNGDAVLVRAIQVTIEPEGVTQSECQAQFA